LTDGISNWYKGGKNIFQIRAAANLMKNFKTQQEKEEIRKKALERHSRLSQLFREDRFSFEKERRRLINEVIESAGSEEQKRRLKELQEDWNRRMKGAGSPHNRLILAQTFFWEHFHEVWQPALEKASRVLSKHSDQ